jgi:hypothetical protein
MKYNILMLIFSVIVITGTGCKQLNTTQKAQVNLEPPAGMKSAITSEVITDDEPPLLLDNEPPLLLEDEPPLLLEDEPLLLLDDEPDENLSSESMADNSRCFVCHINYMQEDIAVTHARAGMGCANCHGESDEHIADESWASGGNGTAPGRMFIRAQINPFCMECHTREKIDIEEHKSLFAQSKEQKYCTDCHGDHRLTERKCKWK